MGRPKLNKTEKLLREIRRTGGMTRKEMVEFLLGIDGNSYVTSRSKLFDIPTARNDGSTYNSLIYGTSQREGLADNYVIKRGEKWVLRNTKRARSMKGPFTAARRFKFGSFVLKPLEIS